MTADEPVNTTAEKTASATPNRQPPPALALRIADLSVTHPQAQRPVLFGLNLALNHGDIACLLGPSGCGKTTLLRAIAGFIPASQGFVEINHVVCSTPHHTLSPEQRQVGMVFQDYALFPHLNVQQNIEFGLHQQPTAQRQQRSTELLDLVGLGPLAKRFAHELSGGQQQRVALARALAPKPNLVLLDEPFSNLDIELRERLATEVRDIIKAEGTSAIMVTHDQSEAFGMADVLGVMQQGRLQQWGAPYNLYHQPANRMVADFIGQGVFLPAHKTATGLALELGEFNTDCSALPPNSPFDVLIRPDDIIHDDASPLQAKVLRRSFRGAQFLYTLGLESGAQVLALVPSHHNHALGERIGIRLELDHIITFPAQGQQAYIADAHPQRHDNTAP